MQSGPYGPYDAGSVEVTNCLARKCESSLYVCATDSVVALGVGVVWKHEVMCAEVLA